ncbi:hypothetical protein QR685DRAFT_569931 [Neurospora intermedia]|uniref:Uncharacterized protein n=1 Tax=Neurospora intermedia TaxID=5142 RepID=A0ABR3DMP5_NEUIN
MVRKGRLSGTCNDPMPTYDRYSGLAFWSLSKEGYLAFGFAAGNSGIHKPTGVEVYPMVTASRPSAGGPEKLVSR